MIAPAIVCGAVTFMNSRGKGDAGQIEYVMPVVPLLHGVWYAYYLLKFQVKELEGGAVLPAAFGSILYLDAFGWSKLHLPRTTTRGSAPLVRPSGLRSFTELLFGQQAQ